MGSLDIVTADTDGHTLFWYENDGRGNFTDTRSSTTTPKNSSSTIHHRPYQQKWHISQFKTSAEQRNRR